MIQLQNISKTYHHKNQKLTVLEPLNLEVNDGEIVGIVGKSGAGKSTLLRLINGLIKPSSGDVIIDETPLFSLKQQDINRMRHGIGMVFQHFNLISSLSAFDNIKLSLTIASYPKDQIKSRIDELLNIVGLNGKESRYPNQLSGGEKQRLGIARAIANHPHILLCDEATSALDQQTSKEIIDLLKQIQKQMNMTIIFISHQIDVIKDLCTRVIVFDHGKLIEDQPIKLLFTHPKHEITRSLVHQMTYVHQGENAVYELIYDQKNSQDSILSTMIKQFQMDVNILFAKTLTIGDEQIGYLYVEFIGEQIESSIQFLKLKGIEVSLYA